MTQEHRANLNRESAVVGRPLARSQWMNRPAVDTPQPTDNALLASLSAEDRDRFFPELELVDLPPGLMLYHSGVPLSHVYFPTTALVALMHVLQDGACAEIAAVGSEGVVGVAAFMGGESTPIQAVVQCAGKGYRMKACDIKREFRYPSVMRLLLRYTQALITQMTMTAACNRHHSLDQRLSRWLLLSMDLVMSPELPMTDELMSNMLGVRREGITAGALRLQQAGIIRYARGHISVLERAGLERNSCECYGAVKREYERLMPVEAWVDRDFSAPCRRSLSDLLRAPTAV